MTMQWTTQELPIANKEGSDQQFLYLLSLIIADYEAEHYPIAVSSTVAFIDHLLEEKSRSWANIRACLGYGAKM